MVNNKKYVSDAKNVSDGDGLSQKKFGLSMLFPTHGDERKAPLWIPHALVMVMIAVFVFLFIFKSWSQVSGIFVTIFISFLLALAAEPLILKLESKGVSKKVSSLALIIAIVVICVSVIAVFGSIFISQLTGLLLNIPNLYSQVQSLVFDYTHQTLPDGGDLMSKTFAQWGTNIGSQAIEVSFSFVGAILNIMTCLLLMYYLLSGGDRFRKSIVSWFEPQKQPHIWLLFSIIQKKISGFLGTRLILALLSIFFTSFVLMFTDTPYWLPLALFVGVISQFIPVIGTFIGSALPIFVSLSSKGITSALIILVFFIVYQQIESFFLTPKISSDALDINPAVAFCSVVIFSSLFGAIGAFLSIPITAIFIEVVRLTGERYDVIDLEGEQ